MQDGKLGSPAIASMRAILVSGVAADGSTPAVRQAALEAAKADPNMTSEIPGDGTPLVTIPIFPYSSTLAAYSVGIICDQPHLSASGAASSIVFCSGGESAYTAATATDGHRLDAGHDPVGLFARPLWPEGVPERLDGALGALHALWDAEPEVWGFWRRWYDGMLAGAPLDWELQRRVALIPDEVWKDGPGVVAAAIAGIEATFWAERLPQHERLLRNEVTGRFRVEAEPFDPETAVESWLKQVEFAVELAADSNTSDFSRMCTAYRYVEHTLRNCRDDPNAIEGQFGIARSMIERDLQTPTYTADDSLQALAETLKRVQLQMRADHPLVRKSWETRTAQTLREIDEKTRLATAEAIRAETARTEDRLTTEMELDAETVATSESPEAQAAAIGRAGGRAAKMTTIEQAAKTVKDVDSSAGFKAVRIGTTGYSVGDIILMLTNVF